MGYYSQVGYVVAGEKEEMVPVLMTFRLTYKDPAAAAVALDECKFSLDEKGTLILKFHMDSCKWYEDFDDVKSHTALFNAFNEASEVEDSSISGNFIRIGEEDNDITTERFGDEPYDLMSCTRQISFEVEAESSLEEVLK